MLMDIRLIHRGANQEEINAVENSGELKILISSVFGADGSEMARRLKAGNQQRLRDWDKRWKPVILGDKSLKDFSTCPISTLLY